MNIVHLSWEYPPVIYGGLGTFAHELTVKQVRLGNSVNVFTFNKNNSLKTSEKYKGVNIYRPKLFDLSSNLYLFVNEELRSWGSNFNFFSDVISYNLASVFELSNLKNMNKKCFDIVDAHDWLGINGGMVAKKELGIPLIFHIHSTEVGRSGGFGSQVIKNIELKGGQFADCIITVSNAMRDELQKLGFPLDKIRVCWNGIDPDKYDPGKISEKEKMELRKKYGINNDFLMLLFIGRLVGVKGVDNLVRAMPEIIGEFPNVKLVILGVGDLENNLRALIDELSLKNKVLLRTDFVAEKERILHYAASDAVILPSLYEPFGIVCTEAMSMAKPVVVGARGTNGMKEQVIPNGDDQCGIHINPYDPKDIAWGVKQVLESKETRDTMGINGRKRVMKFFTWDLTAERTQKIYMEFING